MLNKNEIEVLSHLRQDSRQRFTSIARKTGIHKLTVSNIEKRLRDKAIVKHTSLIDFSNIGYSIMTSFALKCNDKQGMHDFLISNQNINSLSRTEGSYDFFAETIFKNMKDMQDFVEKLEKFGIEDMQKIHIIEDIKREGFWAANRK